MNRTGLRFNGSVPSQGVGPGSATVTQAISTLDGSDLSPVNPVSDTETLVVFNDGPGRLEDSNSAFLWLYPKVALSVSSEITLSGYEGGHMSVSMANSFFTIPEPSAAFIALSVSVALLGRRRRLAGPGPPPPYVN